MNEKRKTFLFLGILFPIVAYGAIIFAIFNAPWFNIVKNALSDLGANKGSDIIFNSGLIISGLLFLIYSTYLFADRDGLEKTGFGILMMSSIFLSLIGVFPEQYGNIHLYVSIIFFLTFPIGILLISIDRRSKENDKMIFALGLIVFIGSFANWFFPWSRIGVTGLAIPELISSLLGTIWVVTYSAKEIMKSS